MVEQVIALGGQFDEPCAELLHFFEELLVFGLDRDDCIRHIVFLNYSWGGVYNYYIDYGRVIHGFD